MQNGKESGDRDSELAGTIPLKSILIKGEEYKLTPINLNILSDIEDKFDKPFAQVIKDGRVKSVRYILWRCLVDNYPELTEKEVGDGVDFTAFKNITL